MSLREASIAELKNLQKHLLGWDLMGFHPKSEFRCGWSICKMVIFIYDYNVIQTLFSDNQRKKKSILILKQPMLSN